MQTDDKTFKKKTGDYIAIDVEKKVYDFLEKQITDALKVGVIDWDKFRAYCHEFGMIEPPNILTIPIIVLDKMIDELIERYNFINKINNPNI